MKNRKNLIIGITGASGLLGTHIRAYIHGLNDIEIKTADRQTFNNGELSAFVKDCDVILHLAGMNRGESTLVTHTNLDVTRRLITALEKNDSKAHVIFSSSTHIERDTAYGRSKRDVAVLFSNWAGRSGGKFSNVILPGVFGEGGKPYYNSVVSTFCSQMAAGEIPIPADDAAIEQVHAQTVARVFETLFRDGAEGEVRVQGQHMTVYGLLNTISNMRELYIQHIIPDLREDIRRDLFNTYRSYLYPQHYPVPLTLHSDSRGSLFEAVKSSNGGQSFISTTHPGITRGNHYHTRKIERFIVTGGRAEIKLRHLFGKDVQTFQVTGEQPCYVDIPTLYTHNITNTGDNILTTLFWTHELFDPAQPDTVAEPVERT
ncbi:NAD-dependent epimerase/dehydratase family protein [Deinococcus altitudinis]|uniref:polysaccharide biosynthesis C-terminal domain-containing protein n=1 Tax=Deinococcus altitudinis TaxID=468914 RepID=UPI00389263FE